MIVIIDYGMGNLCSVENAFKYIGSDVRVSNNPIDLKKASHVVLPGVGAFGDGINNLKKMDIIDTLHGEIFDKKKPFLGICLGMQLLADKGYEGGISDGLGFVSGVVKKIDVAKIGLKLPHIGWNDINIKKRQPLFTKIENDTNFYFVHSYHFKCKKSSVIAATCDYGETFAAAIQKENIFATQFHPEKSHRNGLQILRNFASWKTNE